MTSPDDIDDRDPLIEAHFDALRTEDSAIAPAFRTEESAHTSPRTGDSLLIARAAVVVLAATALLLVVMTPIDNEPSMAEVDQTETSLNQEEPHLLYASIMQRELVRTDELLIVSDTLMPSMLPVPSILPVGNL